MIYPGSLHNHTEYSNLDCRDSTNRINTLIDRAIELGQEVIAFTEHENVCNSIKIEKYYNMVEQNDPTNIEAIFYSAFARVKQALLEAETREKRQSVFTILEKSVSVIDDNYDNTNEEHQKILSEILVDIKNLENELHVQLFKRSKYGMILNENGKKYIYIAIG